MRIPVLISFFLFSATSSAGFYKWVDNDGVVHYTDHPVEQAKELRQLQRENARLQAELAKAEAIIEVKKSYRRCWKR